jgi:hypothetical protein
MTRDYKKSILVVTWMCLSKLKRRNRMYQVTWNRINNRKCNSRDKMKSNQV